MDDGVTKTPVKFWYFFTDLSHGYWPRSLLGSWGWEKGNEQDGQYANLPTPRPSWFNGNQADMPLSVPCRTCPDTCGVFYGWPAFTRTDMHVTEAAGPGVWDYTAVPIASQDADLVESDRLVSGEPQIAATFNREHCRAAVFGFDGVPSEGGFEFETDITDPAYVFTSFSTSFVLVRLVTFPATFVAVFWRIRWYADPP